MKQLGDGRHEAEGVFASNVCLSRTRARETQTPLSSALGLRMHRHSSACLISPVPWLGADLLLGDLGTQCTLRLLRPLPPDAKGTVSFFRCMFSKYGFAHAPVT